MAFLRVAHSCACGSASFRTPCRTTKASPHKASATRQLQGAGLHSKAACHALRYVVPPFRSPCQPSQLPRALAFAAPRPPTHRPLGVGIFLFSMSPSIFAPPKNNKCQCPNPCGKGRAQGLLGRPLAEGLLGSAFGRGPFGVGLWPRAFWVGLWPRAFWVSPSEVTLPKQAANVPLAVTLAVKRNATMQQKALFGGFAYFAYLCRMEIVLFILLWLVGFLLYGWTFHHRRRH